MCDYLSPTAAACGRGFKSVAARAVPGISFPDTFPRKTERSVGTRLSMSSTAEEQELEEEEVSFRYLCLAPSLSKILVFMARWW